MNIKRVLAGLSAAALSASLMATTAFADDEPTVYGIAGVSFQVKDSWEHRDAVGEELLNETGDTPFDATCYDVNITGNGSYEVSLEGWWCGMASGFEESEMGWVSLSTTLAVSKNDDGDYIFTDYPDATIKIDSYTEDGNEYDMSEAEIVLEDGGGGLGALKIVNAWGTYDARGEDYAYVTWQTTDPVIIKFTVEGLPTDKAEDYDEEVIEFISGKGAGDNAGEPTDTPADEESAADDDSEVSSEDTAPEETESVEEATTSTTATASETEEDESSNLPLYLGIGGGVVVVAAIAAIVIKAKK